MARFTRTVAATCLLLGALTACSPATDRAPGGAADDPAPAQQEQTARPSSSQAADPQPSSSPAPVTRGVPVRVPVDRPDAVPDDERLVAPVVPFDRAAVYPDGVELVVRDVVHTVTTGTGAGAQPGQPVTSLTVEVRNGSPDLVDVNAVVVSAVSGAQRSPASPVYGEGQDDLSGQVRPGATRAATYAFTIPPSELDDVTLTVDLDGSHAPAVWRGRLR